MKHKLNVNGDIESRRRIAERRNVPVRETVQQTIQPQHHETEENQAAAAEGGFSCPILFYLIFFAGVTIAGLLLYKSGEKNTK